MEIGNPMDAVQKQVIILSHKVDALHQQLEQLNSKVSESLSEIRQITQSEKYQSPSMANAKAQGYRSPSLLGLAMEHKDVLLDGNHESINAQQNNEKGLSSDIQIQRLTAQLTAAYNRIAALEEQLLARRIHS
jgi:hypothetical protein